jgi:alpha-mannosidase
MANLRCERLLREVELWAATVFAAGGAASADLADRLDRWWKAVLLHQFHDIIPGSSIGWVHDEAEQVLDDVAGEIELAIESLLSGWSGDRGLVGNAGTAPIDAVIVTTVAPSHVAGDAVVQALPRGRYAFRIAAPALALAPLLARSVTGTVAVDDRSLRNELVTVTLGDDGYVSSFVDHRSGRELLRPGQSGAVLERTPDHPVFYDAWDVEAWVHRNAVALTGGRPVVVAAGPLVGEIAVTKAFGRSTVTLTYRVSAGSARLEIDVDIDWHEDEQLLSLAVPIDVRTDIATCGIQFGHVQRPVHASTAWDAAKFEVAAHRWIDVSEPSFGVAVLNNGRYGHAVVDGVLRVTLLRSTRYPDPDADRGRHHVTVAVLPHGPGLSDVVAEAERLNVPLRVVGPAAERNESDPLPAPPIGVSGRGVVVTAVKLADDGSGDLVVRAYEALGDRTTLTLTGSFASAARAALTEEPLEALSIGPGRCDVPLRPFEIVTIRLSLGR